MPKPLTLMLTLFAAFAVLSQRAVADVPPPYELFGIGATLDEGEPFPKIAKIDARSPAEKAGLKTGDGVIAIDGAYSKTSAPFYFFARGLNGKKASEVVLVILRDESQVKVVKIRRTQKLR
jgi:S1-C subfamily serine protease